MDPNNVVGTPSAQPQPAPAPTAAATISAELAAAPEPAKPENPMTAGPEKKSSKGGIIAAVLFALIAAGGVGFGVWTMMDGKTKEEQYNTQIDALKKTNSELMDKIAEGGEGGGEGSGTGTAVDTEDYIYVGEWGVKFKIPDNLQYVSYEVEDFADVGIAGTSLCVSAATTGHGDERPSFLRTNNGRLSRLGCLNKYTEAEGEVMGVGEVVVGEYYYVGPQALVGNETDADWESESVNTITNMLSTDNMSDI